MYDRKLRSIIQIMTLSRMAFILVLCACTTWKAILRYSIKGRKNTEQMNEARYKMCKVSKHLTDIVSKFIRILMVFGKLMLDVTVLNSDFPFSRNPWWASKINHHNTVFGLDLFNIHLSTKSRGKHFNGKYLIKIISNAIIIQIVNCSVHGEFTELDRISFYIIMRRISGQNDRHNERSIRSHLRI